ncbi:MAG: TetR/AcrR family transcriptional regulator [Pseudomonadota bacterium]
MSKPHSAPSLTQAERTALSDRAMIDAACTLLLEKGASGTTLAAIGERAGYSRGLATYRFGSKAGLFAAIGKAVSKRWLEVLNVEVGVKTGVDAMCAAIDAYARFVKASPDDARIQQVLFSEASSPTSESKELAVDTYRHQVRDVMAWLEQGIADGDVRADIDAHAEAVQFIAFLCGVTHLWLLVPDFVDFDAMRESAKQRLRRHLSSTQ